MGNQVKNSDIFETGLFNKTVERSKNPFKGPQ